MSDEQNNLDDDDSNAFSEKAASPLITTHLSEIATVECSLGQLVFQFSLEDAAVLRNGSRPTRRFVELKPDVGDGR